LRVLVDTCVWLDMVKDYRQKPLLTALESMIREGEVSIVLPATVCDEFARNKERVIKESQQSLSSTFRRVKDAVRQFGREAERDTTLSLLSEVDHRIGTLGEAVNEMIGQVEVIFAGCAVIETSDAVKLRAADRAIAALAPFHRKKNSFNDAILIETFTDLVCAERAGSTKFAFVSSNHSDFSVAHGDIRQPHPDLSGLFDQDDTTYSLTLDPVLRTYAPDWFVDFPEVDLEALEEPRRLSQILEAIDELFDKVWYNRHLGLRNRVMSGQTKVVDKVVLRPGRRYPQNVVERDIWKGAVAAAGRVETKFGDDLGPWTDFEWGMINGKLSALRWVLGDEWDMLDT
jgi:hypothetical protein